MPGERTLSIDFDGVIHKYSKGWQDGSVYDNPVDGAFDGLIRLQKAGYTLVICTARDDLTAVQMWMLRNAPAQLNVSGILITNQKMPATAYIDDRAIRFTNWDDIRKYFV